MLEQCAGSLEIIVIVSTLRFIDRCPPVGRWFRICFGSRGFFLSLIQFCQVTHLLAHVNRFVSTTQIRRIVVRQRATEELGLFVVAGVGGIERLLTKILGAVLGHGTAVWHSPGSAGHWLSRVSVGDATRIGSI